MVSSATLITTNRVSHACNVGGEKVALSLNGKEICVSMPNYEADQIVGMSHCDMRQGVKRGDMLSIETVYDLPKHPL
jgi:hypothetical protein